MDVAGLLVPRCLLCLFIAFACVRLCVALRSGGFVSPLIARKSMHALTGPTFCCMWLIFPDIETSTQQQHDTATAVAASISRYVAASIPLLSSLYFALVGVGVVSDAQLVRAVSRSGAPQELLLGPLLYGLVNAAACCLFWLQSPAGVFLILCLCIGDGVADVAGRWSAQQRNVKRFYRQLPWNAGKTVMGSAAMFVSTILAMTAASFVACHLCGLFRDHSVSQLSLCAFCIAAVGTMVESLPIPEIDNLTVFAAGTMVTPICC